MSVIWYNAAWSVPDISVLRLPSWIQTKEEKNSERDNFNFLRKREVERSQTGEFNVGEGVTWWATWRRWRLFNKNRSKMIERFVCNFKMRGKWRAIKSDKRGRPSRTMWRKWKKRAEVKWLTSFERFICKRDQIVLNYLIYLEPEEKFHWEYAMWWNIGVLVTARRTS